VILDKDQLKEKLLDFWEELKDFSARVWEEMVDRGLDLWDSFKKLKPAYQVGIAGGIGAVALILILVPIVYTPELPVSASQNTTGIAGGNWIAIQNLSDKTLKDLTLILDQQYIYQLEQLAPNEITKIFNRDFHYLKGKNGIGEVVGRELVGENLVIVSPQGEAEFRLVEKKKGLLKR